MIRLQQVRLPVQHTKEELLLKIKKILRLNQVGVEDFSIYRKSLDARKKSQLYYSYTIDVDFKTERALQKKLEARFSKSKNIQIVSPKPYHFTPTGKHPLSHRPIIVGSGPSGLFCAYFLAKNGYRPLLLERGASVEERLQDVEDFWQGKSLKPDSNVQFGEGGAGTFSDGKLHTLVNDAKGRNRAVLELFVAHGAPSDILYEQKPHLGTDVLVHIVRTLRQSILDLGGEVRFHAKFIALNKDKNNSITSITLENGETIATQALILALGHSARDTFEMLYKSQIEMSAKSFAVGLRIQHTQSFINEAQYGNGPDANSLPPAAYKLATKANGRGVYSFCMCPGGYVVNASSTPNHLAINGMSYSKRDGQNANAAIVVTVDKTDFGSSHPLAGMEYARKLESNAYSLCQGAVPTQLFGDFESNQASTTCKAIAPMIKGNYAYTNLRHLLTEDISTALIEGIYKFDKMIPGFASKESLLCGIESRTSSPIRIQRDETLQSNILGVYPCGEGAGYAGGITSAAIDGIKVAEEIMKKYTPPQS